MVEISNRMLATLLVVAMVISVFGTISAIIQISDIAPLIQAAGTTAEVNITVINQTAINVSKTNVTWGAGLVDSAQTFATLNSLGQVINGNWTPTTGNIRIENTGSVNITLDINAVKTAANFIGGTSPAFRFNVTNIEGVGNTTCIIPSNYSPYISMPTGSDRNRICLGFDWRSSADEIEVGINLTMPEDSLRGSLNNTVQFTATIV